MFNFVDLIGKLVSLGLVVGKVIRVRGAASLVGRGKCIKAATIAHILLEVLLE